MAKRSTGVGKPIKTNSHKTKKRLEIKRLMLEEKANKKKEGKKKAATTSTTNTDKK